MSDSPNFLTYAQTAFDPFEERPFCAVDSLVFAWLSYLRLPGDMAELTNWQGLDVRELLRAECYRDMIGDLWDPEGSRALLEAVAASPSLPRRARWRLSCRERCGGDRAVCSHGVPVSGGV